MNDIIKDYLGALDERASQVCGLNQGHQYLIGAIYETLKKLQLQGYELDVLKQTTKRLKGIIEEEKKWIKENQ